MVLFFFDGFNADLHKYHLDLGTGGKCLRPVLLFSLRFGACGHLSDWGPEGRKGKLQNLNILLQGEEIKERSYCHLSLFGDSWMLELFLLNVDLHYLVF